MKSQPAKRLNQTIRKQAAELLITGAFKDKSEQIDKLKKRKVSLYLSLVPVAHELVYGKELSKQLLELPDGWLPKANAVKVRIQATGSDVIETVQVNFGKQMPIMDSHRYSFASVLEDKKHRYFDLAATLEAINSQIKVIEEERREEKRYLLAKVQQQLKVTPSVLAAKKSWPEAAGIIEKAWDNHHQTGSAIAVVDLTDLNTKLHIG